MTWILIQNKKNKSVEEWITDEQWQNDFIAKKMNTQFNVIRRSENPSGTVDKLEERTSTVQVVDFIKQVKEKSEEPKETPREPQKYKKRPKQQ